MAPLKRFTHKNTVSYILGPDPAPVLSQWGDAQEEEFSIVVPAANSPTPPKRKRAAEESVDAVLHEIENSKGSVVKYRVRFGDGGVYDVSASSYRAST